MREMRVAVIVAEGGKARSLSPDHRHGLQALIMLTLEMGQRMCQLPGRLRKACEDEEHEGEDANAMGAWHGGSLPHGGIGAKVAPRAGARGRQ